MIARHQSVTYFVCQPAVLIGTESTLIKDLVSEARHGNASALDRLLQVVYPGFLRSAKYAVRNDDAAKDIVQETLIRLSENLSTLRDPEAFSQWAQAILKRCCITHFRRENRLRLFEGDFENLYEIACVPDSEEPQFCARSDLIKAIESLGSNSQEVVRMHYFFGLSVKEIAVRVRVSAGAVRVRLHRARNELRDRLLVQHGDCEAQA
jgi:RNA polymerase sigma-70 factor (ECF subfamily)